MAPKLTFQCSRLVAATPAAKRPCARRLAQRTCSIVMAAGTIPGGGPVCKSSARPRWASNSRPAAPKAASRVLAILLKCLEEDCVRLDDQSAVRIVEIEIVVMQIVDADQRVDGLIVHDERSVGRFDADTFVVRDGKAKMRQERGPMLDVETVGARVGEWDRAFPVRLARHVS